MSEDQSPYDRRAFAYLERGYCVIPIAPGTKRPGSYSEADGWRGMHDWERYFERLPTDLELEHWGKWPGAGIGLLCGKLSGVIALDRDYDAPGTDALEQMIPYTPVKKKGVKGYTAFFRWSGEKSCSFNVGGARVLDVLSDGRQTLMPGTLHPDGHTYIYLTEDLLEDFDPADLPELPPDFLQRVTAVLAPYQTPEDRKYASKPKDTTDRIDTSLSVSGQYFRELNARALDNLDTWVTKLIPTARRDGEGYRCIATWRDCEKPNVGINPRGIFDFGGNYGMTAIDLIRYANGNLPFHKAADALRSMIPMETTEITMTVGGSLQAPAPQAPPVAPAQGSRAPFPWEVPAKVVQAPPSVMLPPETSFTPAPAIPNFLANPPGILGDIARWITDTAPKSQPELSVAAALAVASVVMGRTYRSQFGNFTSLYFVMVAKSTEGKEHPQGCCEKILAQAGLEQLIGGSGYTSAGAVYSALLKSPAHLVTIDEMGKLLKLSRSKGNANAEAAIDKLVEAFGRHDGVLRPPTYSTMTLREGQAPKERVIHNPAISLLGATTPATFFDNLTADLVKDGFLGRCIVVESKQPRQLTRFVDRTDPPAAVVDWCKRVHVTGQKTGDIVGALAQTPDMAANTIPLLFDVATCKPLMDAFELELNEEKEAAELDGLDVLLGRTLEKAMKVAMIVSKAKNPHAKTVTAEDLNWSIQYVRHYDTALVRSVKRNKHENEVDEAVKKAVEFVRSAKSMARVPRYAKYAAILQAGAVPHSMLLRHMHLSARAFNDLVATATGAGLLLEGPGLEFGTAAAVFRVGADAD